MKIADRLGTISLLVSLAAFCLSAASLYEEQESRRVENEPQLVALDGDLMPLGAQHPNQLMLEIPVRNHGQIGAKIDLIKVVPTMVKMSGDTTPQQCIDDLDKLTFESQMNTDIPRQQVNPESVEIDFPPSCSNIPQTFSARAVFQGKDELGNDFKQDDVWINAVLFQPIHVEGDKLVIQQFHEAPREH